jgi:hypothetical protein
MALRANLFDGQRRLDWQRRSGGRQSMTTNGFSRSSASLQFRFGRRSLHKTASWATACEVQPLLRPVTIARGEPFATPRLSPVELRSPHTQALLLQYAQPSCRECFTTSTLPRDSAPKKIFLQSGTLLS